MNLLPRTLANGQTTVPAGDHHQIYRAPRGMRAVMVRWMSLSNPDTVDHDVEVYLRRKGVLTRIANITLDADGGSARVIDRDEQMVLSPEDGITVIADAANQIVYTLVGVELPK